MPGLCHYAGSSGVVTSLGCAPAAACTLVEHVLRGTGSGVVGQGLCALLLVGLCEPGVSPAPPALAGRFLPTEPPGEPCPFLNRTVEHLIIKW